MLSDLDKLSICLILSCTVLTSSTIGVFFLFPGVNRSFKVLREEALGDGGVVPWNSPRRFRFSSTSLEAFADDDSPCTGELTQEELALEGAEEEGLVVPLVVFVLSGRAILGIICLVCLSTLVLIMRSCSDTICEKVGTEKLIVCEVCFCLKIKNSLKNIYKQSVGNAISILNLM